MRKFACLKSNQKGATAIEYGHIYDIATITRMDICCDSNSIPHSYYPKLSRGTHSQILKSDEGKIASIISGSGKSRIRLTIYDKNVDAAMKGYPPKGSSWIRMEIRLRLNCPMKSLNMMRVAKEFSKFEFFGDEFLKDDFFLEKFRRKTSEWGLDRVFTKLDPVKRERYRGRLRKKHKRDPWNLENIESHGRIIDIFLNKFKLIKR